MLKQYHAENREQVAHQAAADSSAEKWEQELRQQIAKYPGMAINLGLLSGFLIGWWVKR